MCIQRILLKLSDFLLFEIGRICQKHDVAHYESFIYKSSSFKVSLPQCAQDSIAWESYVIMYINDINLSTSTFRRPGYPI